MIESENESDENSPPRKHRKLHYEQKYSKICEKESEYAGWIKPSNRGNQFFYCTACNSNLKCGGGKFTISKHAQSHKHISNIKGTIHQPPITSKFSQSSKSFEEKVKSGEMKMACFLAKNNLSFNVAGNLKNLIQSVCPDSELAKQLTFGRTKAHAIVTNVTGKVAYEKLLDKLRNGKFSLIADESTDRSTIKHMALIVRTATDFKVEDSFLCLLPVSDCTAVALHRTCKEFFEKENIPYKQNMIGFACDGANNMSGDYLSLAALFAKDIPNLFIMKCICHSFHLCASYACKELPRGVEDFARDVYSYLKNSPKRLNDYQDFQKYLNIKPNKLLHPSQTRWLSLLPVV
ncbi:uncharacterized protein LOC130677158 [Microplitis mediator]|uniref:uncharacterized protein LOC130677158 n=1 Tax=Microplitis mediator TaxID=375433 RepID=UPI0025566C6A|nr:uncharacterized protein LOC130677158 [Microplitis mediator]